MTNRDKTLKAIKREIEGFVPYQFDLCDSLTDTFEKEFGTRNYKQYYNMVYDINYSHPKNKNIDFSIYFKDPKKDTTYNEFGVAFEKGSVAHFTHLKSPMQNFTELSQFKNYPYPDGNDDFLWDDYKKAVQLCKKEDKIAVAGLAVTIFEIGWYMRGMEDFMMDMYTEEPTLCYHLERLVKIRCDMARQYALCGADVLHLGDDIATQNAMMFSLDMYRKWIKPYHKAVIDSAKEINPNIIVDYHSDGNCQDAIPDLIDIGVDVLNPVQPECMDPKKIKKLYGNNLSFRGTIGTQTVLPFGTPKDVKNNVLDMIENVGKGGGLILAPSHLLEPEVPWDNIKSFVDTIQEHNAKFR